jgi:hypothetical protein
MSLSSIVRVALTQQDTIPTDSALTKERGISPIQSYGIYSATCQSGTRGFSKSESRKVPFYLHCIYIISNFGGFVKNYFNAEANNVQ